jgi:hypothetical protein
MVSETSAGKSHRASLQIRARAEAEVASGSPRYRRLPSEPTYADVGTPEMYAVLQRVRSFLATGMAIWECQEKLAVG